jgi:hypothetical protein
MMLTRRQAVSHGRQQMAGQRHSNDEANAGNDRLWAF